MNVIPENQKKIWRMSQEGTGQSMNIVWNYYHIDSAKQNAQGKHISNKNFESLLRSVGHPEKIL